MKKNIAFLFALILCFSSSIVMLNAETSTVEAVVEHIERLGVEDYFAQNTAPTNVSDGGNEAVSGMDGGLNIRKTDFSLSQRYGRNLEFNRVFNSNGYFSDEEHANVIRSLAIDSSMGDTGHHTIATHKLIFVYYLNEERTGTPVFIAYDSERDMMEREQGTNSIQVISDYMNFENRGRFRDGDLGDSTTSFENVGVTEAYNNEEDYVYYADKISGGTDVTLYRDINQGYIKVTSRTSGLYEYSTKSIANGFTLPHGWKIEMPTMFFRSAQYAVNEDNEKEDYKVERGSFFDPETGVCLHYSVYYYEGSSSKFDVTRSEDIETDPTIEGTKTYIKTNGYIGYKSEVSNRYKIWVEFNKNVLEYFIERDDGVKFCFKRNYTDDSPKTYLTEIEDRFGEKISYSIDKTTGIYTIKDTYNRSIVLSESGICVNGIPMVSYDFSEQNNSAVDTADALLADNVYTTNVTYHLDDTDSKTISYTAHVDSMVCNIDFGYDEVYWVFDTQTMFLYRFMMDSIILPTGGQIEYEVQPMVMMYQLDKIPIEQERVVARLEKQSASASEENKTCYAYTEATNKEQMQILTHPGKEGYQEKNTYNCLGDVIKTERISAESGNAYYISTQYDHIASAEGTSLVKSSIETIKTSAEDTETTTTTNAYYYNQYDRMVAREQDGELVEFWQYELYNDHIYLNDHYKKRGDGTWIGENYIISYKEVIIREKLAQIPSDGSVTWTEHTNGFCTLNAISCSGKEYYETIEYSYNYGDIVSKTKDDATTEYTYAYNTLWSSEPRKNSLTVTEKAKAVANVTEPDGSNLTGTSSSVTITRTQTYDFLGRLVQETDDYGHVTTYTYDYMGRQTGITHPDNSVSTIDIDDNANTYMVTDETGRKQKLVYDAIGREKEAYVYKNDVPIKAYSVTYDSQSRPTEKLYYNEDGTVKTKYAYTYYADGQVKSERVLEGETELYKKEFTYSPYYAQDISRTTAKVYQSQNQYMTVYQNTDKDGFLVEEGIIDGATTIKQTYTNDKLGNVLSVKDFNANAQGLEANTVTYTYDYANRVMQEETAAGMVTYTYDVDSGFLVAEKDGRGNETKYSYKDGRMTQEKIPFEGDYIGWTKFYYDKNGNITRKEIKSSTPDVTSKPAYDVTRSVYDSRNRLIAVISEPSEGQTEVVRYTYDAAGRLLSMATGLTSLTEEVNPAVHSVTTYAYDDLGNVTSETDALGKATTYTYDLLGNALTKTDRNGTVFTYTYDALGRNTAMTAQNGEQTQTASYTYDYLGNLTRVVDNGQEIVYTYDVRGNLLTETQGDVVKTYAYDANGNRTSFVLAEGLGEAAVEKQNLTYSYDTVGRLMSVTNGAEITAYTYDANHNLTAETTGTAGQTPVHSVAYTYNKANLLTGKTNTQNGTVIENYTATYFANGNKKTVQKGEQTTAYTYDGMGRLLTETEGDDVTAYSYTPFGNRATKTVTADGETTQTITYAYDKNNRLTKEQSTQDGQTVVTGYTYDHNGNQIIKNAMVLSSEGGARSFALGENNSSTEFFTYDLRNRLTQYKNGSTKASYTYGADGFRDSKTVNGVTTSFIYDGANIVETKQGESVTDYIRGIGLIKYTDGTTTAYYFTDDHGSTSSLYGATGTKLSDYTYDAFGNEEQVSSTNTNPFRYCGEYTDQESGLVYLRARYYDPQTGRFISEDPVKDGLNWYVYCHGNPVNFVDTNGLKDVGLREWIQNKNGVVKIKKKFLFWGLKSITVSLPGQSPKTYTKNDYTIREDMAYIDDTVLNNDFKTDGVYSALIYAYGERGKTGQASRQRMKELYPDSFNPHKDFWCITFVSWALEQAGLESPKTYSVARAIDWYTNKGNYSVVSDGATPYVGDTMFVGTQHSGLVIAYDPPWVYTIEGCSTGDKVNVVKRHESTITGYGRNGGTDWGSVPEDYDYPIGGEKT